MSSNKFDLGAGVLCLDFANTANLHASDHPEDVLSDFSDLIEWGTAAEILSSTQAEQLRLTAASQPESAAAAFENAIQTREAIFRIFSEFSTEGNVNPDDMVVLNKALSRSLPHLRLIESAPGFAWDWAETPDNLDRVLWAVVRSAGDLLTSDELDRVRQCANDRSCDYLFVDRSRNRSRRWCSMESCGNRAKARRHYQRQTS